MSSCARWRGQPAIAFRWKGSRTFDEVVDEHYVAVGQTRLASGVRSLNE